MNLLSTFNENYIVCGRGQRKYNSKGNKTLRKLVADHLSIYIDGNTSRSAKSKLVDKATKEIFGMGMTFVKMDEDAKDCWLTLSFAQARTKVAHRFRDAARRIYSGDDKLSPPRRRRDDCAVGSAEMKGTSSVPPTSNPRCKKNSAPRQEKKTRPQHCTQQEHPVVSDRLQSIMSEMEVLITTVMDDESSDIMHPEQKRLPPCPSTVTLGDRKDSNSHQDFSLNSLMGKAFIKSFPQHMDLNSRQGGRVTEVFHEVDADNAIGDGFLADFDDTPQDVSARSIEEIDELIMQHGFLFDGCSSDEAPVAV